MSALSASARRKHLKCHSADKKRKYDHHLAFSSLIFSKSFCNNSIVLGISFSAQSMQICWRESGYVKYFTFSAISRLHDTHFFILYGSVFLMIKARPLRLGWAHGRRNHTFPLSLQQ